MMRMKFLRGQVLALAVAIILIATSPARAYQYSSDTHGYNYEGNVYDIFSSPEDCPSFAKRSCQTILNLTVFNPLLVGVADQQIDPLYSYMSVGDTYFGQFPSDNPPLLGSTYTVSTNADGAIVSWDVDATFQLYYPSPGTPNSGYITLVSESGTPADLVQVYLGPNSAPITFTSAPGGWVLAEPSSLTLVVIGLVGLLFLFRNKYSKYPHPQNQN